MLVSNEERKVEQRDKRNEGIKRKRGERRKVILEELKFRRRRLVMMAKIVE